MRRIGLALVLVLGLSLLPGAAWAHHRHHGFHVGCCVFIGHGHPFIHHHFHVTPRVFHHPPQHVFFDHHGVIHPHDGLTVIGVSPAHQPVWIPGFWWWNGFQWVWVPGHWGG